VDRWVFGTAGVLTVAFIAWGVFGTDSLGAVTTAVLNGVMKGGGWAFVLAATGFVVFALWLAFSRYGRIPLGRDGEAPEFRTVSWIAMMFSAGMGIGLMFYGVNEPLTHFTKPPPGTAAPSSQEAWTWRWRPPCSTGRCTRGRSTRSSGSRSPTRRSARAAGS
jgi:choline-glycine betaine transporter